MPPLDLIGRIPGAYVVATVLAVAAIGGGVHAMRTPLPGASGPDPAPAPAPTITAMPTGSSLRDARRLFPGPDPVHGGIVLGEAYRVDEDRAVRRRGGLAGQTAPTAA